MWIPKKTTPIPGLEKLVPPALVKEKLMVEIAHSKLVMHCKKD